MQRRKLLKGMLALPVATALGCRPKEETEQRPAHAKPGTLKLYLHGPFAVVLNAKNQYRIKAFVPFDADGKHEFRFPTPKDVVSGEGEPGQQKHYEFRLGEEYLDLSGRRPRIDAGFGDFQLHTGEWTPSPADYFVSLDLPAPEVMTFVPRAVVPVSFVNNRLGLMPLDHILEYKVRDFRNIEKVKLHAPQLKQDYSPLTCKSMLSMHSEAMNQARSAGQGISQPHLQDELKECDELETGAFFLGVGLSPKGYSDAVAKVHALKFFNGKLLASFPNAQERKNLELQAVGVGPCATSGAVTTTPTLSPAVQRFFGPMPQFRQITSFEECRVGGVIGTTP